MPRAAATTLMLLVLWEISITPAPAAAQATCRCECSDLANGRRACRRVCLRTAAPQPNFEPQTLPNISNITPSASTLTQALSPIFTALLFITGFVCVSRLVRLAREHSPPSPLVSGAPSPPPGGSAAWWRDRKLRKLTKSTAIVRANQELITARLDEAHARRQLEQLLDELRAHQEPVSSSPHGSPPVPSLTLAELEQLINSMHELNADQRAAVQRLLALHLAEKGA